jgi:hypothetical protein
VRQAERPCAGSLNESVLNSAPYLDFAPGDPQLDTRTSSAPFLAPLRLYFSPLFTSLTSFTSVPTPLCFDASFLANGPNTFLATHALGAGGLRDE